ncbi:unnamed protein product [Brassica oleracea]
MHDQIRDMGTQMVLEESGEGPGMRSRLWDRGEIMTLLNNMKISHVELQGNLNLLPADPA